MNLNLDSFAVSPPTLFSNKQMYDIIGDIHGRTDELEALLLKLGY
ncbi:hypothetical protein [Endozoicomonas atrinae]|nr:hypothetical protein [Endozoicomonas atrinae]